MTTLTELLAQRDTLDAQIKAIQGEARSKAITEIREIMTSHGLSLADIGPAKAAQAKGDGEGGKKVAAKYHDGEGRTWSGRGLQPRWFKEALGAGKTPDDMRIS